MKTPSKKEIGKILKKPGNDLSRVSDEWLNEIQATPKERKFAKELKKQLQDCIDSVEKG